MLPQLKNIRTSKFNLSFIKYGEIKVSNQLHNVDLKSNT